MITCEKITSSPDIVKLIKQRLPITKKIEIGGYEIDMVMVNGLPENEFFITNGREILRCRLIP